MALGYHINSDEGLINLFAKDSVSVDDAIGTALSLLEDADFDPQLAQLVDLRGLDIQQSPDNAAQFSRFLLDHYSQRVSASIAVVIDEDLDAQRVAGSYWLTCALPRAELFDDYDQALRWLIKREFATAEGVSR